ncbi:adenylate/guanylate cyclase domain-containing protein [Roseibium algae]|uniref:Adenylate/guanylate cyclase domain-containing protein n=1 Tax=Roseibium algae TaxID=3123038 RepID=A0ABU8TRR4_9HYPH
MSSATSQINLPSSFQGKGNWRQQARLASGLTLFAFCLSHFINHSLGIWSLDLMQKGEAVHHFIWGELPGLVTLSLAAITHVVLALWRTARRRTLRLPVWETLQLALGFYIPWTLIPHVLATSGLHLAFDVSPRYQDIMILLWPGGVFTQTVLLLVVWSHSMIGLHFWLRLKPWYTRYLPAFAAFAVAMPLLALWGWTSSSQLLAQSGNPDLKVTASNLDWVYAVTAQVRVIVFSLLSFSILIVLGRLAIRSFAKTITITYPGDHLVRIAPGPSLLEISRASNIPLAAVCGGRARCSTCRVKVVAGLETLDPPSSAEEAVLKRIGADEEMRLACQIRPQSNLSVRPLVPVRSDAPGPSSQHDAYYWGVEQPVAVMFIDMRNFTGLTEQNLPFDTVYLLNRYLDLVSQEVRKEGGHVDKFIGDGIMAIFGMQTGLLEGTRQALRACKSIGVAIDALNTERGPSVTTPLRIGIGLHAGSTILGRIGAPDKSGEKASITALGDVVNVASRLEGVAKEHNALAAISKDVLNAAALQACPDAMTCSVDIRGRQAPLEVICFQEHGELPPLSTG